jgi:hypothetical protein
MMLLYTCVYKEVHADHTALIEGASTPHLSIRGWAGACWARLRFACIRSLFVTCSNGLLRSMGWLEHWQKSPSEQHLRCRCS